MQVHCNTCSQNNDHNTKDCKKGTKEEKSKYCSKCKTNTHNTVDCKLTREPFSNRDRDKTGGSAGGSSSGAKKIIYTGKIGKDGAKGTVPDKPDYVCTLCNIAGHLKAWCPKV